jgi:hypothetical protein
LAVRPNWAGIVPFGIARQIAMGAKISGLSSRFYRWRVRRQSDARDDVCRASRMRSEVDYMPLSRVSRVAISRSFSRMTRAVFSG